MARKKPEEKKDVEAVAPGTKFVRLELSLELHRQLRMEAAAQEKSMAELARTIVVDYLKGRRGGKK